MDNICIAGAGRIAYSLSAALIESGFNIASVYSRTLMSAEKLASAFNIAHFTNDPREIPKSAEVFILAVPDSEIKKTAELLSGIDLQFNKLLFIHLSGSLDVHQLCSVKEKGASVASFHIMQTFPTIERVLLKDCYAAVETSEGSTRDLLFSLARRLSMIPFSVDSDKKSLYHLSGVFASNFLVASLFNAQLAFESAGIMGVDFTSLMNPIISSTVANIRNSGVPCSLSGPVKRGDYDTIVRHIETLAGIGSTSTSGGKTGLLLLRNYISASLTLLELLERSEGPLNQGQMQIRSYLNHKLDSLPAL